MAESIHQTYRDILQEIHSDNMRNISFTPNTDDPFGGALYVPKTSWGKEKRLLLMQTVLGVVVSVGISSLGFVLYSKQAVNTITPPVPSAASQTIRIDDTASIRGEMELMKKILVGLVESVQGISSEVRTKQAKDTNLYDFPYPVQVISDSANLRDGPSTGERSLGIVSKDTVLLAVEHKDGWVKVSTPKGEQAWISEDVVTERKE